MRYLTVEEVLELHARLIEQSGGSEGLRDAGALASVDEQERVFFSLAAGEIEREEFTRWVKAHLTERS